ncbi:NAD(P)-dependent dehydrogenase (short-subunit alcohol dehydrogenase family) [Saccharothrix tamanrassetensis]|uniref:NAD(P)-dependent dehydrogenase (Short-subunit alcohol dehydrogenase family) n=1 Tax=Saccharothrix tamanrassetensis TaxID=1051531 RepID=A0A841CNV4_9PSEU|nr:SDR family NAD(P)-dependent oxidoreductase [Saccharothrix tamanrassetensis]MBB5957206.1 NAD(P)-dependent dehydrogenase (short-subunit alcohol dehydrogenase family) [Saccharothrix tamanrassetensis]
MSGPLAGRVALVTGAARGIGRACAVRLAEQGADLVLLDIGVVSRMATVPRGLAGADELSGVADEVRALGRRVVSRFVDVRDGDALGAAVRAGVAVLGSVDIAVPAAVVRSRGGAWTMPENQWRAVIEVNLTGVWQTAKAVAPVMVAQRSGSIVFIGPDPAHRPAAGHAHLVAAEHGVWGLARSFALELAGTGVRANSVDPGPLDGTGQAAVADAVLYLASDEARGVTGSSILAGPA